MNFVSIVGARPEFVQVAVLSRALRARHRETLVHTGQHYDAGMSGRFFADLEIAPPEIELGVGSLPPSAQVGEIMHRLAEAMGPLDPDAVIVRGDTNSTLAGALVAKQLLLPLVHVEAGMRSYDRTAPEEINRLAVDHIADLALTTDEAAAHRPACCAWTSQPASKALHKRGPSPCWHPARGLEETRHVALSATLLLSEPPIGGSHHSVRTFEGKAAPRCGASAIPYRRPPPS